MDKIQMKDLDLLEDYVRKISSQFKLNPVLFIGGGVFILITFLIGSLFYFYTHNVYLISGFVLLVSLFAILMEYFLFFHKTDDVVVITQKHLIKIFLFSDVISFVATVGVFIILLKENQIHLFPALCMILFAFVTLILSLFLKLSIMRMTFFLFLGGIFLLFIKKYVFLIGFSFLGFLMIFTGFYLKITNKNLLNNKVQNITDAIDTIREKIILVSKDIIYPYKIGILWGVVIIFAYFIFYLFRKNFLPITLTELIVIEFFLFIISAIYEVIIGIKSFKEKSFEITRNFFVSLLIGEATASIMGLLIGIIFLRHNLVLFIPSIVMLIFGTYFIITSIIFTLNFLIPSLLIFVIGFITIFIPDYAIFINAIGFSVIMFLWGLINLRKNYENNR